LKFVQLTEDGKLQTSYEIECSDNGDWEIKSVTSNSTTISIKGKSQYGCPVFEVSSIWKVFDENWVLFGIILLVIGVHMLFFGRVAI
jgi:hypothetical protein